MSTVSLFNYSLYNSPFTPTVRYVYLDGTKALRVIEASEEEGYVIIYTGEWDATDNLVTKKLKGKVVIEFDSAEARDTHDKWVEHALIRQAAQEGTEDGKSVQQA